MTEKDLQQQFVHHFLYTAYSNMEMEQETNEPFNYDKLYQRYKITIDALIKAKLYKKIAFKYE